MEKVVQKTEQLKTQMKELLKEQKGILESYKPMQSAAQKLQEAVKKMEQSYANLYREFNNVRMIITQLNTEIADVDKTNVETFALDEKMETLNSKMDIMETIVKGMYAKFRYMADNFSTGNKGMTELQHKLLSNNGAYTEMHKLIPKICDEITVLDTSDWGDAMDLTDVEVERSLTDQNEIHQLMEDILAQTSEGTNERTDGDEAINKDDRSDKTQ